MTSATIEAHRCWPLAVHESAHAVVGVLFGLRLARLEIDLRAWQGVTFFEAPFPPGRWREELLVSLAGTIAQKRADPSGWSLDNGVGRSRAAADLQQARRSAGKADRDEHLAERRMAEGQRAAAALVNMLWPTIAVLAERLLDAEGRLDGDAVALFLERELPRERRAAIVGRCAFAREESYGG